MAVRFFKNLWEMRESAWFRYSLPFVTMLGALLAQGFLAIFVGKNSAFPFAFFYLMAVFATAWIGGAVPGIIACVLTMVGLPAAVIPGFSLAKVEWIKLAVFAGVSLLVSWTAQVQRRMR